MMTCKDVSTLISTGALSEAPLMRRLAVRVHLTICRRCRAFRRQVEVVARAACAAAEALHAEPAGDFEANIVDRMRREE
jgi:anti-sigma factor ChrR (cupin superfamily)